MMRAKLQSPGCSDIVGIIFHSNKKDANPASVTFFGENYPIMGACAVSAFLSNSWMFLYN